MKLYYAPMTRSSRPRWLLEEIGAPHELVKLDMAAGDHRRPEYLRLNPLGRVPTLVDGDVVIHESAAILAYVADKFPEAGMAPPPGSPERGEYYKWLFFAMATLEPPLEIFHRCHREGGEGVDTPRAREAKAEFQAAAAVVSAALADREYILGDRFSAADVPLAMLNWARRMGALPADPVLEAYLGRLSARPAFARASR